MSIIKNPIQFGPLNVIGLSIRTTNENQQATIDIPQLWNTFFMSQTLSKISNKINDTLYCIYNNYESDYTKPYTCTLGIQVENLFTVPEGLTSIQIPQSSYIKFNTKGDLSKQIVYNQWKNIWTTEIDRKYTFDFEIYDHQKCKDAANAEVEIYISIK